MVLEAIDSIMKQGHGSLEIIVVDDGSADETGDAVRDQFPGVHLLRLDGAGPGPARNAGVAASAGEIIMFLDSDDLWLHDHVAKLVETLNRGFKVAYGVTENLDTVRKNRFLIPDSGMGMEGDCFEALLKWCFLVPSSVAMRRDAFMAVDGFDAADSGEDWLFFIKLAARFPFGYAGPVPITLRKLHRGSLCFLNDKKKLLAMISRLFNLLEKEPRATAAHRDHFAMLHDWTAARADQWSTVQDWYMQLLKEKII